jgi:hypothetical protein
MSSDDAESLSGHLQELQEALETLYELLEAYAPVWYTEEHHDKATAALRSVKSDIILPSRKMPVSVPGDE